MRNIMWTIFFVLTLGLTAADKPNIIWIFSDDHSYQTIGAYGGRLAHLNNSPNIDSLAKEGMIFNRCYVGNSICAPARATLLTGKHSHKNGKFDNRDPFNHDQQQFQKLLQKSGYQTAMIGKIHLHGKMQGFDYWEVLPGQGKYYDPDFVTEEGKTSYKGYVTDIITDKAIDWLDKKRDKNKPFMCMIHQKAPHRNWQPAQRHMELYEDIEIPEPANLFDDYSNRATPSATQDMSLEKTMRMKQDLKTDPSLDNKRSKDFYANPLTGKALVKWKYQQYLKDFMRCTKAVDENVGRVLEYLKESGLEKNTIVMYSSDQGFYMGEHGWFDKRMMYEESYRTPFLVKWPGTIKPGSVNTDLVQNIDFAPTFLDICGVEIPADMDGVSVVPLLKGEKPADWRKHLYYTYYEYPAVHSVRRHEGVSGKRYKLIRYYGPDVENGEEWELFDLKTDPGEMNSQYSNPEYASVVAELKKELINMRKKYQLPTEGPDALYKIVPRKKKPKKK
ncbi:MAG: sulfatase [Lentisphaerales bacterium]|nr:sulfatase [Lentisphaerales bacterium]